MRNYRSGKIWSKVQERTRKEKANKEKEDFKTNICTVLWETSSSISSTFLHLSLSLHVCIAKERKRERERERDRSPIPRNCWFLVHITNKKFSIDICPERYQLKNISWSLTHSPTDLLPMETRKSVSGNKAIKHESLEFFQILSLQKLLFCCSINACHNTTISIDIITLAFIVLHSHSFLKRICIKQMGEKMVELFWKILLCCSL